MPRPAPPSNTIGRVEMIGGSHGRRHYTAAEMVRRVVQTTQAGMVGQP